MKKIMVAATAALVGIGTCAGNVCVDEGDYVSSSGCCVYDLQLKVKTLTPKHGTCKANGSACADSTCNEIYYLDNVSKTLKGYIWFCDDSCWTVDDTPYIVLWDTKTKTPVIPIQYTKTAKSTKYYYEQDGLAFTFLGRYGKKMSKVAAAWEIDTEYIAGCAAGLNGSLIANKDEGTAKIKTITGNFAGQVIPSDTIKKSCEDGEVVYGTYADLCDCIECLCDAGQDASDGVPASGTWSLKYNKKISNSEKPMFKIVPKYALRNEDV